ncbi:hypothetical protein [Microbulbifer discodermiae]|uniref:hypothetical protein n=1 Tax=Microbulbifer sp. 2201CG32-9 TaxID=3232309 RepID=UPI00345B6915
MVKHPRQRTPIWASLLLLVALITAQPVLAEHIHFADPAHELCDICFNHMPATLGSEYRMLPAAAPLTPFSHSAPVASDSQPERQSARAPPAFLLHQ